METADPYVELDGIGKRYGGVVALSGIDLRIERGSIHGLVGENGAGKSTLGKIIGGVINPDAGQLRVLGRAVSYHAPRQALDDGITVIAQEISLVPDRTVIENVFLGNEPARMGFVSARRLRDRYADLNERAGFDLPPGATVATLRLADQQKVEILRALARQARLIVMDEPTSSLSAGEASKLFEIIRRLNRSGTTVVYVSHFLQELLAIADTVTVLKDGRHVRTSAAADESPESLVTGMLGRSLEVSFPPRHPPPKDAPVVLEVEGLRRGRAVRGVSFSVRRGEIVGLAGLVGSGRSETARLIFGADRRDAGDVWMDGSRLRIRTPRDAVRHGIAMLPESRKDAGLVMGRSVVENVSLPHLAQLGRGRVLIPEGRERAEVGAVLAKVDVRAPDPAALVASLSGGNQQKVVFAKWLFRRPRLLIADEPTRGVDVGAKRAIYDLIAALAADGMAVLLISSDLEEVLGLAHRTIVMRAGEVVAELGADATEEAVMAAAFATHPHAPNGSPRDRARHELVPPPTR
jgi:ABC-type sugar transport system ATPase subunit